MLEIFIFKKLRSRYHDISFFDIYLRSPINHFTIAILQTQLFEKAIENDENGDLLYLLSSDITLVIKLPINKQSAIMKIDLVIFLICILYFTTI